MKLTKHGIDNDNERGTQIFLNFFSTFKIRLMLIMPAILEKVF